MVAGIARLEILTPRRLLAISVTGTAADDLIIVNVDAGELIVFLNGSVQTFPLAEGESLVVDAGAGNDTVDLSSTGDLPVSVEGGDGADHLTVGGGDWRANVLGNVTLRGGLGNDLAVIDDSAGTTAHISIANPFNIDTQFGQPDTGVIFIDAGTPDSSVERTDLLTGPEADQVSLLGISSFTSLRVLSADGNDSITVGTDFDSRINGQITLDAGDGRDELLIDDSADAFGDTYLLAGKSVTGTLGKDSTPNILSYTNFTSLHLIAGMAGTFPNNQFFRVSALPLYTDLTIDAGTGDDALTIGSTAIDLATIQSTITFNAGDGFDRVEVFDSIGMEPAAYTVAPGSLNISGQLPIFVDDLQFLTVHGNAGNNLFDVIRTPEPLSVTVDGGAGNDEFRVGAGDLDSNIGNVVSVLGGAGLDRLILDDSLDGPGNDTYLFSTGLLQRSVKGVGWTTTAGAEVERVELIGSANVDTVRISSTSATTELFINAGAGDDSIFADRTADVAGVTRPVHVASGEGNDSLAVNSDNTGADALVIVDGPVESLAQLNIRAGGRVSLAEGGDRLLKVTTALTVSGLLDLNDQTLIISGGSFTTLNTLVASGFNNGTWIAAEPAIISSFALLTPTTDSLAVVTAESVGLPTYAGVPTAPGDVIVRYTLAGDANLDRAVDFGDLLIVAQNYAPQVGGRTWIDGNFTYGNADDVTGAVGFDDLLALAQNYAIVPLGVLTRTPDRTRRDDPRR